MRYFDNKCDTLIKKITYKGVELELVERPAVLWTGCIDYAADNESESDYLGTLKRFQSLVEVAAPRTYINPDWSAAISINYKRNDKPCGMFFGNEVTTDERDERYDCFINRRDCGCVYATTKQPPPCSARRKRIHMNTFPIT